MDGETLGSYCVLAPKKPEGFDEIVESGFFKKQVEKAEEVLKAQAKIRRERQLAQMNLMMQPQVIGPIPSLARVPLHLSLAFDSQDLGKFGMGSPPSRHSLGLGVEGFRVEIRDGVAPVTTSHSDSLTVPLPLRLSTAHCPALCRVQAHAP